MNEIGIDKVTMTLIHLLCSGKRDGLILLDGKWGTGKTYYLNTEFKKKYNEKTVFIISALGINSLDMFKSALFNESYLNLTEDIKEIPNIISPAIALSTKTPSAAAPINTMIVSVASAIKKNRLSALEGIFVIDDIERINPKLAEEILNYCHSIYIKNDKLDFIIVSNTAIESSFKLEHKEKIISDVVPFIPAEDDIYTLFEEKLSYFEKNHINQLKRTIKKHNLVNNRVIGTIISGLSPLFEYHKKNTDKQIKSSLELVISVYSALIMLSKLHHYTLPKIGEKRSTIEKDNTDLGSLLDEATATGVPIVVKQYAFNIASTRDVIESLFYDRKKINIDEVILTDEILTSGIDEQLANHKLIELVCFEKKTPLKTWLDAVQNYQTLTSGKYIKKDSRITNDFLMSIADTYSKEEVSETLYIEKNRSIEQVEIEKVRNDGDIRKYLSYRHSYNEKSLIENKIKEDIINQGWQTFNTERLERIGHKFSPIKFIGVNLICECVLTKWKIIDILKFRDYLINLYNFSNIESYLSGEYTYLEELSAHLTEFIENDSISFRYGAINSLMEVVNTLIKNLQARGCN